MQAHCNHVQKLELKYWKKYDIIQEICEILQISEIDSEENKTEYHSEDTVSIKSEGTISAKDDI